MRLGMLAIGVSMGLAVLLRRRSILRLLQLPARRVTARAVAGGMPRFVQLPAVLSSPLRPPAEYTFDAREVVAPLWKYVFAEALGARCDKLMSACKNLWPHLDRDGIKVSVCQHLAEGRAAELAEELLRFADERVAQMGPRLPPERRAALLAENARAAEVWRKLLVEDAKRLLDVHRLGGAILLKIACSCKGGPDKLSRHAATQRQQRGIVHEQVAVEWARSHWPQSRVIAAAHLVPTSRGERPLIGIKTEFDALVVDQSDSTAACNGCEGTLVAVVEAKVGAGDLIRDLQRMHRADRELMGAGQVLTVRTRPKASPAQRIWVDAPPHLAYVFGCADDLEAIVSRSVALGTSRTLLERATRDAAAAGDAGRPFELRAEAGRPLRVRAVFPEQRVCEIAAEVATFETYIAEMGRRISFWSYARRGADG